MNVHTHEALKSAVWEIANRLRGPYRPPQYRLVMLEDGRAQQDAIRNVLATLEAKGRHRDRKAFEADLDRAAKSAGLKLAAPIKKAIFAALGERDPEAGICRDGKGRPEPDSELRDTENIPLPAGTVLPLPMDFGPDKPNDRLTKAFRDAIDAYMAREVLPHVADAWVDYDKTKVGYEIPVNRHFYVYKPPRPLREIETDIRQLEGEIADLLKALLRHHAEQDALRRCRSDHGGNHPPARRCIQAQYGRHHLERHRTPGADAYEG